MTHDRSALDALAQLTRQRGVSRRGFLRGASLSARALSGGPLLAACGVEGASKAEGSCVSNDLSRTEKQLHFSTWPLYIDQAKVKRAGKKETVYPSMERFQKESGITVDYVTESTTMPSSSASCATSSPPASRQIATSFALTDYMAGRMVGLGWIQKLDRANLGNVEANLVENLRSPSWDKNRDYSVPWQSGLTGIAYNAKLTGEVRSFDELLTRSDLKGKVSLLSEMNDTMIFMLLLEGADPEDSTDDEFGAACDRLQKSVAAGQIRAFTGNEYAQDLVKGNVVACEAWSGDVIQLQFDNPDIKFVAPEEGLSLWSDNMLVPNKGAHKNAEALMNYYCEPEVAAGVAAWVNYICPVAGAQEAMAKIDPSLAENELIFPGDDLLARTYDLMSLDQKTEQKYQQQFAAVIGA